MKYKDLFKIIYILVMPIYIKQDYKQFNDIIHGDINISNIAALIIDTPYFQRLADLHQLGTCHYVFRCATHTRFEHSIGVYHLAGIVANIIKTTTNSELLDKWLHKIPYLKNYYERNKQKIYDLDDYVIELIKIAGLCHDLGHGPFSHVYDDVFIPKVKEKLELYDKHEYRSGIILEHIIKSNPQLNNIIHNDEIILLKKLINPKKNDIGFIYQIISNNLNGIDVDKCDYISRDTYELKLHYGFDYNRILQSILVIDNNICFPQQLYYEIISLFTTRYRLHKQIYNQKSVISTQYMINDIMYFLNNLLNISNSNNNIFEFVKLTDNYILNAIHLLNKFSNLSDEDSQKLNQAENILNDIKYRNLYRFIGEISSDKPILLTWEDFNKFDSDITETNIIIDNNKIKFTSSNYYNFFNHIYFYNKKNTIKNSLDNKSFIIQQNDINKFIPTVCHEYVTTIFSKNNKNVTKILTILNKLCKKFNLNLSQTHTCNYN